MIARRTLLCAAAALPFAACRRTPPLRIGYQNNGLLLAAKARGAVEAALRPVPVAWALFPSGPPLLEALSVGGALSGVDVGGTGDTPPIFAQAAGARIVYIAAQPVSGTAAAIVVPRRSRLRTAADLRGAKLAFTRGSSAQAFVRAALATVGLGLDDVSAVNLTPVQARLAFAAGAIDAWAIWDPFLAAAEVELGARVLVAGAGLARSTSFVLANADAARAHPDLIMATLDALVETGRWAAAHRNDLAALIAGSGVPAAVASRIAARQELGLVPLTPAIVAAQQHIADTLFADHQLPGPVAVAPAMWHGWTPHPGERDK